MIIEEWETTSIPLSVRERECVEAFVVDGAPNKEIGRRLFLSEKTVKFHIQGAMRKLGAQNRTHLALLYERLPREKEQT